MLLDRAHHCEFFQPGCHTHRHCSGKICEESHEGYDENDQRILGENQPWNLDITEPGSGQGLSYLCKKPGSHVCFKNTCATSK